MKRILIIATLLLTLLPATLKAQSSNLLYGSSRNPLMNSVNPAFFPNSTRLFISLPNINMDFTSPVSYSDVFSFDPETQRGIINANQVLDNITNNRLFMNLNVHPLGIGLKVGGLFVTASLQSKTNISFGVPQGLTTLITEGNVKNLGPDNPLELIDNDFVSILSYAEGAVGVGLKVGKHMTLGARAKMLVGVADISNAGSSVKLTTAEDYSSLTADMNLSYHCASVLHFYYDSATNKYNFTHPTDVESVPKNYGYALDLGFRYTTELFELTGSIIDLGKGIHWEDGIQRVVSRNGNKQIVFEGVDISNIMQGGQMDVNVLNDLIDSLKQMTEFDFVDEDESNYWTTVPTKVNLGGMLHLSKGLSAGILFHGEFINKGDVHSNTALLARINLADWIELIASTSVVTVNDQWNWINPGFGLTLTPLRKIQVYTFVDYISDTHVIDAKRFNMSFGLNLLLGRESNKKKKYDPLLDY
jgi:hypothetical protein